MNCPIHLGAIVLEREKAVSIPCGMFLKSFPGHLIYPRQGHVFCLTCITTYFDRKSRRSCPCPICKKPFTKTQMVQLFMVTRSPSSSPAKSKGGSHHLSAMQKDQARILRQDLQNLDASSSVENVTEACEKMDRFVESMAGVTDIETKVRRVVSPMNLSLSLSVPCRRSKSSGHAFPGVDTS
ncbi:hypothetical protein K439DRAFT_762887 [Ramaria rubella]|nr:hypothetical protein K439DRAFT_762887 [Ramaria rubella]